MVSAVRWLEEGILPPPLRINLVFGVPGGIDASPEALEAMLRPLPSGTFWTVTCIGRHHPRMLALALLHGAPGIRTGLEDVAYMSRGVLAPSNAALVGDGGGPRAARSAARSPRRSRPGSSAAWLSRRHRRSIGRAERTPPRRRGPRPARRSTRAAHRAVRAARLPRDLDARDRSRGRVQPAAIYHWYPSKEAILVRLQDDFMERLTEKVVAAHRAGTSARR